MRIAQYVYMRNIRIYVRIYMYIYVYICKYMYMYVYMRIAQYTRQEKDTHLSGKETYKSLKEPHKQ